MFSNPATPKTELTAEALEGSLKNSGASTVPTPMPTPEDFESTSAQYKMSERDLVDIKDELVSVARAAGKMMRNADPSVCTDSDTKKNSSDRVTACDKEVEAMIISRLESSYPEILFLGEETFKEQRLTDAPTFVCDPIDGTLNFIHGVPNCATSLSLTIDKKPVIGVVYNPFRDHLYTAIKGQGAYFTDTIDGPTLRLPRKPVLAPLTSLNNCLLGLEWGSQRDGPNWELRTDMVKTLLSSKPTGDAVVRSIRTYGSAALDFCYVAASEMDVFWEGGCWSWDVSAGWIILLEAGGMVASANPDDWNPTLEGRCYLGVRKAEESDQRALIEELWALMGDRKFVY
ncbi:carbohydrate phosphatase [Pleomassaria siparia CBS 279.74]|uniref:Inositol-1-monophosphatase n=1 Tax=Pleomassaria siparia CBS 279.74 TaxID=1314801 RepID=A0A6G1KFA6_9PLEO|nr:carbohydrate phosphatase [Pleomassaria siparia CBS 279.74]